METTHTAVSEKLVIVASEHKEEEEFWLKKFSGHLEKSIFPYDYKHYDYNKPVFSQHEFRFSGEVSQKLIALSNQSDPRLHIILTAALMILLSKYSNSMDVIVGTPIYKQDQKGTFINTVVPLRNPVPDYMAFRDFLLETRKIIVEAISHQSYPLEVLLEKLNIPLEDREHDFPLFDIAVLVDSIHDKSYIRHININTIFIFRKTGEHISGILEYNSGRYRETSIKRIISHFEQLLLQVLSNSDIRIADIDVISNKEREQLLVEFNDTGAQYPGEKTLHGIFEEQVEKSPHHTALVLEESRLTYLELNKKANRLASRLRKKGCGPDTITAVLLERSMEMIAVLLGILKAGSAYLPIDVDIPLKRLASTVKDSGARVLLTDSEVIEPYTFEAFHSALVGGSIHITQQRPQILDFNSIPVPDRSLVDYEAYNRYLGQASWTNCISLQATRGCPYKCAYCHKIWPKKHVIRSAENIFAEVQLYYNMGVRRFALIDDIFNLDKKNSTRFFELIIENGLDIHLSFPNGMRGDILTREYIDLMIRAGIKEIALALETASPGLQKLIGKNLDLEKFRENIEYICEKYPRVSIRLYTMIGFPSETEEEAMETLNFIKSLKWLHYPYLFILKIYPNTDMAKLAIENGIPEEALIDSLNLAYHELPGTLPFDKSFVLKYQIDFLYNYFLLKERLLYVLPYQLEQNTEDELVQNYNGYLPNEVDSFDELLEFFGITREEIKTENRLHEEDVYAPELNRKMKDHFKERQPDRDALKVLLLDLSLLFSTQRDPFSHAIEPPLGLMYILTYLYHCQGSSVHGKIGKSRMDFDSYEELKIFIEEFNPDVIGIRALSMQREFFHKTAAMIRQWGIDVPIITGGPYATSSFKELLQDGNIDIVVVGEGEITFNELIEKIKENNKKLPNEEVLKNIKGIAYNPNNLGEKKLRHCQPILLDTITTQLSKEPHHNLPMVNQPADLAYVIFTSGTTGKPKGVLIEHGNVVRLMFNDRFQFDFNSSDIWSMCHAYNFDFSVWEMYGALLYGGKLVIIQKFRLIDPEKFPGILEKEKITVFNQTPSAFFNMLGESNRQIKNLKIRYLIFGGEALTPIKLKQWQQQYDRVKIINMYGITETTVHVTYKQISVQDVLHNISNIGKPIPTLTTYILDHHLKLTPPGIAGEICVGGAGLARGYLNRSQLTGEKFCRNPFDQNERLYRSGDLGRILEGGEIEYLGRIDHQVKIRGYRIELGEIENQLLLHSDIKEAVVMVKQSQNPGSPDSDKYLTAYIVVRNKTVVNTGSLKEHLSGELPAYMVPLYFVQLDRLPLTISGKIDRRALSELTVIETDPNSEYMAPQNPIEEKLSQIWAEVLGRDRVGISDNFFNIGGDSIKSIRIATRMKEAGWEFDMKDFFKYPTIRELAPLIKVKQVQGTGPMIEQAVVSGTVPLTPIQYEFFKRAGNHPHHFNQTMLFSLEAGFNEESIRVVFEKLQEHHDVLRMTFKEENGTVSQENQGLPFPVSLRVFDLRGVENPLPTMKNLASQVQSSIRLHTGPLMKLALFHLDEGDRLLVAIHHLVVDGVSWRILFEDIDTLYRLHSSGEALILPPKTHSFKYWAEQLSQYANSETFLQEKAYWHHLESQPIDRIATDFPASENSKHDEKALSFRLSAEETELLLTRVNEAYGTEINDILLTSLGLAFEKTFGYRHLLIGLEGHGRETILPHVDIHRTLGWFTTLYPVRLDFSYARDLTRQVKEIKETLRRIPHKGIGYGILKYLTAREHKQEMSFHLEPQVSFNYLGQFGTDLEAKNFRVAGESAGDNVTREAERGFELEISGVIGHKRLLISIVYNKKHFRTDTMNALLNAYREELSRIIKHCASLEKREFTPADFTYPGLTIDLVDQLTGQFPVEDIYTLTPLQEGMLYYSRIGSSSAYFVQTSCRVYGRLDPLVVKKSLDELLKRYDILRTMFVYEGIDPPVQVVLKQREADFYYEDISEESETRCNNKEAFINEFKARDRQRLFDMGRDVLVRVALIRLGKEEYEFTWSHHHILMDGWCVGILISEFFKIHNSFRENKTLYLPPVLPFRTYINWLSKQDKPAMKNYWQKYLESYEDAAAVPVSGVENVAEAYDPGREMLILDREKTQRLKEIAAENQVTMSTLTQTVWGILLGKYNGKEDIVFGSVVSGRPYELTGVETMVGLFINTIPVRIRFNGETRFNKLIQTVQKDNLASEPYHYYPLAEIQNESALKHHLIRHIFVFENYPIPQPGQDPGESPGKGDNVNKLRFSAIETFEHTNYDFNVILDLRERLNIRFEYDRNVYDDSVVKRIARHFEQVLLQVIEAREIEIRQLNMLTDDEKKQVLYEFNETGAAGTDESFSGTLHQLFEKQVELKPGSTALVETWNNLFISYDQLNKKSNQLARLLREKGVVPDVVVGLMIQRSVDMIVAIMAILKAGGAFLALDPEYPRQRIEYMIYDSAISLLLLREEQLKQPLREGNREIIALDRINPQLNRFSGENLDYQNRPGDLVYVIYTSGSTGKSKGVMLEHRNMVNLIGFQYQYTNIDHSRMLQFATISFDASSHEIFSALLAGGVLHLVHKETRTNVPELLAVIGRHAIKTVFFPMSFLKLIFGEEDYIRLIPNCIRHIQTAGEQVMISPAFKEYLQRNHVYLHNHYGPSETHVVTTLTLNPVKEMPQRPPIGKPISNTWVYILDKGKLPLPIGAVGELYIGGEQLGRGYLDRPRLTAEMFIYNPLHNPLPDRSSRQLTNKTGTASPRWPRSRHSTQSKHLLLYRTGDLGRWLSRGDIEFIGRIDHQVKIRGFRIEPGEIESQLLNHNQVKDAILVAAEDKNHDKYLCAYIVPRQAGTGIFESTASISSELRKYLAETLPDYMIPGYFMQIDRMPLSPSGKLDLKALPVPEIVPGPGYTAPMNEIEKALCSIWSEVLGIEKEKISTSVSFFELGGHSLKSVIMLSKIHKELNVKLLLAELFKMTTIGELAEYITNKTGSREEKYASIEPVEKKDYYILSSAQKRLFALQQMNVESTAYNMPQVIPLAAGPGMIEKLEKAFIKLMERHETLRTAFVKIEDYPVQRIYEAADLAFQIEYNDNIQSSSSTSSPGALIERFTRPFDLSRAPQVRVGVIPVHNSNYLIVDIHHIISDGVSHSVLVKDFMAFYREEKLPPLKTQYKDFAVWQNNGKEKESIRPQEEYWLKEFAGEIPLLNLPTDYPRPPIQRFEGDVISFMLGEEETKKVKTCGTEENVTLFMVILSVFTVLLSKVTGGQEDIIVGTGTAGRRHAELQDMIGMFVNTLALRNYPQKEKIFKEFLKEVKNRTLEAFENQDYQFEDLVEKLVRTRDWSRNPLVEAVLVFQNLEEESGAKPVVDIVDTPGKKQNPVTRSNRISKFDITLFCTEAGERLSFTIEYSTALFKKETIQMFTGYFKEILSVVMENPGIKLKDIKISSELAAITPDIIHEDQCGFEF